MAAVEEPGEPPRWTSITREQVHAALGRLDGEFRTVCQLRLIEGLSYDEIAARLGVPRSTVGTRLLRARDKLRVILEEVIE